MSFVYDDYLKEHVKNVNAAWVWMLEHLDIDECYERVMYHSMQNHDSSKYSSEEYSAYDEYFYGGNRSSKVVNNFKKSVAPSHPRESASLAALDSD